MKISHRLLALVLLTPAAVSPVSAQEPVVAAENPESLFTDPDPKRQANKQVVLHILRDLIQCGHWDEADQYLTERYLQHNPNVTSGRDRVVEFFASEPRIEPCEELTLPIVTVLTNDDTVGIVFRQEHDDPRTPGKKYTTISYDQWRIVDGRADEHWDTAIVAE